jgi:Pro-kumamolisin, activation domain
MMFLASAFWLAATLLATQSTVVTATTQSAASAGDSSPVMKSTEVSAGKDGPVNVNPFDTDIHHLLSNHRVERVSTSTKSTVTTVRRESAARLHERKDVTRQTIAPAETIHQIIFGVKRLNMGTISAMLDDISNPFSDNYGQYLNKHQLNDIISNPVAVNTILSYFASSVPEARVVARSQFNEYITLEAPVSVWNKVLQTTFHVYIRGQHRDQTLIRTHEYTLPVELSDSVSFAFNTVDFPPSTTTKRIRTQKQKVAAATKDGAYEYNLGFGNGTVTPPFLNYYYGILNNNGNNLTSQAVYESLGQVVSVYDLNEFQETFDIPKEPIAHFVPANGYNFTYCTNANDCGESELDVEYLMAVSQKTPTTYWYSESMTGFFLEVANTTNPPKVILCPMLRWRSS